MFFKIGVLTIRRKTSVLESFFNKVQDFQACNSIKKGLRHMCFHVNITKFLRTAFFKKKPPMASTTGAL